MAHHKDAVIVNTRIRQALSSVEKVTGTNGLHAILRLSQLDRFVGNFPPDKVKSGIQASEYARFNAAIEEFYLGSLGEAILGGTGKDYKITETHWLAKGDPYCRFEVGDCLDDK